MTVKVTSKLVQGLVDGYTGEPLEVHMTVTRGSPPLYNCPDAFSVHAPHDTLESLQDDVSMQDGVRGVRDRVNPVDVYTGERLKLRTMPDGRFCYAGGLNPRRAFRSLDELLYFLTMRAGESRFPKPGEPAPVERPPREARDLPEEGAPSDATKEAVEKIVAEHMPRGTSVSMAGRGGKGGRRR